MNNTKKITLATIKKFIREGLKNNSLYIKVNSSFNGSIDCVDYSQATEISKVEKTERAERYTLGIKGAWFVGESRDHFTPHEENGYTGYYVSNCCGSFILLTK